MESKNSTRAAGGGNPAVKTLKAHLALNVRNVNQSIEFYRAMFDLEPSKVRSGYAKFDVQNPPLNFTLNERRVENRGALSHLGIQVSSTEDVLAMRRRWNEAGLLTRDEMQTSCCYAVQDKTWISDPDGNEWEVFVVLEDNLAESAPCECGDQLTTASTESNQGACAIDASETPTQSSNSCCTPTTVAPVGIAR
jgi:catechol 2,3-dioxygenase-like lactoylglutathione lyase family enzyme